MLENVLPKSMKMPAQVNETSIRRKNQKSQALATPINRILYNLRKISDKKRKGFCDIFVKNRVNPGKLTKIGKNCVCDEITLDSSELILSFR